MATLKEWPISVRVCIATVAVAAALAGCGNDDPRSKSVALSWTLIDVGDDGRSLRVQNLETTGGCDSDPAAKATDTSPTEIRIEVTKRTPTGDHIACPAIASTPRTLLVRLDRAVDGQRITGPKYLPSAAARTPAFADSFDRRNSRVPPLVRNTVGLRLDDARRVLRAVGVRTPDITGDQAVGAVVRDQRPKAGQRLAHRLSRRDPTPNRARLTVRR